MKKRLAKKIVRNQMIRCRSRIGGPENIRTGGRTQYPESKYRIALLKLLKRMDRETAKPTKGSIERCADIYKDMNRARVALLISRSAAELRKEGTV